MLDGPALPGVVIGGLADGSEHSVLSQPRADGRGSMASVVDRLHTLGHRRIAHIAGLPSLTHTERRIRTLREEAAHRGPTGKRSPSTELGRGHVRARTASTPSRGPSSTATAERNQRACPCRQTRW
ncbi:type 1 periplasmic-binding domain-containing protein [Streptomyces beihaiensis]|uniref:hypothetical protein n=1 Tax=Streptomyces beihaiensis TaxID=2984495 RepID=UPI00389AFDE2